MTDDKLRAALKREFRHTGAYNRIAIWQGIDRVMDALAASATDEGSDFCPDCGNVPGSQRWQKVHARPAVPALDVDCEECRLTVRALHPGHATEEPTDLASERGRLLAERDRLISEGVDPVDLDALDPLP